jgi:C4-dicarboxylate-specific signal transduction histidine kinase
MTESERLKELAATMEGLSFSPQREATMLAHVAAAVYQLAAVLAKAQEIPEVVTTSSSAPTQLTEPESPKPKRSSKGD